MTSLATLLDHLDNVTGSLERPGRRASPAAGRAWSALARAAAGSLLRVPTLDPPDAAPLYRALFGLADWPRSARTGGRQPLHQLTRTYQQIGGLLAGLPGARGRDQLHAEALRERLLRPLHAAAVWTLRSPDVLDSGQEALLDALARHTPDAAGPVTGTRYGDLGAVTRSALDPVDRVLASWREGVTGCLHPAVVSTAGLRATLADLTIATATAYYLVKTVGAAGLLDRSIAVPAGTALWEARQEWRAQARAFPDDLRLGAPCPRTAPGSPTPSGTGSPGPSMTRPGTGSRRPSCSSSTRPTSCWAGRGTSPAPPPPSPTGTPTPWVCSGPGRCGAVIPATSRCGRSAPTWPRYPGPAG